MVKCCDIVLRSIRRSVFPVGVLRKSGKALLILCCNQSGGQFFRWELLRKCEQALLILCCDQSGGQFVLWELLRKSGKVLWILCCDQ